jgi:hypothetical protein
MRARTPSFIWIPFVFSIGTISWGLLLAGLAIMAAVILTPALREVNAAEKTRNDYQATLQLLDQKIQLQKDFTEAAGKDPVLMERLASRQLNLNRKDQDILILDSQGKNPDRSVRTLLADSLTPVVATQPKPLNPVLALTLDPDPRDYATPPAGAIQRLTYAIKKHSRTTLIILGCGAIGLSFFLGVKYQRH